MNKWVVLEKKCISVCLDQMDKNVGSRWLFILKCTWWSSHYFWTPLLLHSQIEREKLERSSWLCLFRAGWIEIVSGPSFLEWSSQFHSVPPTFSKKALFPLSRYTTWEASLLLQKQLHLYMACHSTFIFCLHTHEIMFIGYSEKNNECGYVELQVHCCVLTFCVLV